MTHIPGRARHAVRDAMVSLVWKMNKSASNTVIASAFKLLSLFPAAILHTVPASTRKVMSKWLVGTIMDRLEDWRNGAFNKTVESALESIPQRSITQTSAKNNKKKNTMRALRDTQEGAYGKTVWTLLSDSIYSPCEAVIQTLLKKHPQVKTHR